VDLVGEEAHRGDRVAPLGAGIFEQPDHLSLFRVHADDGQPETLEPLPGRPKASKLAVTIDSTAAGDRLLVDVECEVEPLEEWPTVLLQTRMHARRSLGEK
jgi:hypothetical protein